MPDFIDADVAYLSKDSHITRRFVAPGQEMNTGTLESRRVRIGNARPTQAQFKLDLNGFELFDHASQVRDFDNKDEVSRLYPDEITAAVKTLTGADVVLSRGWMNRTSGDIKAQQQKNYDHRGGLQPQAADVHVDYTPAFAERIAAKAYRDAMPDGMAYRRFTVFSVWRPFSEPPQDWPLAVCDSRSVAAGEGVANTLHIRDSMPTHDEMFGPIADENQLPAAAIFHFNPAHRWWYFPHMTRDEILMFKFHDSDQTRAWRTPHVAFHDSSQPLANPRKSIELRVIAYYL